MILAPWPYLMEDKDRHGNRRWYVRFHGRKERLRVVPGEADFPLVYQAALDKLKAPTVEGAERRITPGTFEWLGRAYMCSTEFRKLNARSQRTRVTVLEGCFAEPSRPGRSDRFGDCPLS